MRDAVIVMVHFDMIVRVHLGFLSFGKLKRSGRQWFESRSIHFLEQPGPRCIQFLKLPLVEPDQKLPNRSIEFGQAEKRAMAKSRHYPALYDKNSIFHFCFGEKRALQMVATVTNKFSPLRIPFTHYEDRALKSLRFATTGVGIASRISAARGVCVRCRSNGLISTSQIRLSLLVLAGHSSAPTCYANCAG